MADELIIDDEFQRLLAPLSDDERRLLEISIKTEGVRDPLTLWGSTLVDGHNRKDICERLGVDWECRQLDIVGARAAVMVEWPDANVEAMDDRTVVGLWIIRNQSGRRNLTNYARCELQFEAEKRIPGRKKGRPSAEEENFPTSEKLPPTNRVKDAAARAGVGHDTYAKAKAIHEAVEEGVVAPEVIDQLKRGEESVNTIYTQLKQSEKRAAQQEKIENLKAKEAEPATGEFDVIVMDPPWPMEKIERDCRPNQVAFDYPTMTEEELAAMAVPAAEDCHLWVWTTHKFMPMALRLVEGWGFRYVCTFVWHKPGGFQPIGLPQYNCEFAIYARRGVPIFTDTKSFNTCFEAPRGKHSEKPEEFYEVLRRVTAGRRLDMFNRREIEGFDRWGNEA